MTAPLITGLGGAAGFGENILDRNDDGSTGFIDLSAVFEDGLNFFGNEFSGLFVNNNGSVTFESPRSTFTPDVITAASNNPEITPFFGDVDTRGGVAAATAGGNSTGSNLVYYDIDSLNDRFTVTWDDVGFFSSNTSKLNAFQLILTDRGDGDFDIEFRYEDINWTTGNASGGSNGLGGTIARAGFTSGTGNPDAFFELPASGDQAGILGLEDDLGNTGEAGRWLFAVRNGDVVNGNIPNLPDNNLIAVNRGDPHLVTLDGVGYDFQAAGEFVLLRDTSGGGFEIQSRMTPVATNVSINEAVATQVGATEVMIDADRTNPVLINGVETVVPDFQSVAFAGGEVFRSRDSYTIVYAGADGVVNEGDSQLIVDIIEGRVDLAIQLNGELLGDLEGLLGDGDGNPANDIARADGTVLARPLSFDQLYGGYRDDWQVKTLDQSLFTYDSGEGPDTFFQADFPGAIVSLDQFAASDIASAQAAAEAAGLTPGTLTFDNAVLDFLLTNDESFFEVNSNAPALSSSAAIETTEGLTGTGGADRLIGTPDDDVIRGLGGADTIRGKKGDDTIEGGGGKDKLFGNGGGDDLDGGGGKDLLKGGGGKDTLDGGRGGKDTLEGGGGKDLLLGGKGANDLLSGGGGRDTFQFTTGDKKDRILDFAQGEKISIIEGAEGFEDLSIAQRGDDVLIRFSNVKIFVDDQSAEDFTAADFLFG